MTSDIINQRPPAVHVRPAGRKDLAVIARMIAALAAHHGDPAAVDVAVLRRDGLGAGRWIDLFVAEAAGAPIGYAMVHRWYRGAAGQRGLELQHLYVEAEHRGAGVGRHLIEAVLAHARAQHCAFVSIGTTPGNKTAQEVYRHLGFEPSPPPGPRFRMTLARPDRLP